MNIQVEMVLGRLISTERQTCTDRHTNTHTHTYSFTYLFTYEHEYTGEGGARTSDAAHIL